MSQMLVKIYFLNNKTNLKVLQRLCYILQDMSNYVERGLCKITGRL